jgi:hypothetical protein
MKPTITAVCLLLCSFCFWGFAQTPLAAATRIPVTEIFTTLSVDENLDVVLTSGPSDEIWVEGSTKHLSVQLTDSHLRLAPLQPYTSPAKIYVPATYLSKIYMNGAGSLSSASLLNSKHLRVILFGEASVAIRSTGRVSVETADEIRFVKNR